MWLYCAIIALAAYLLGGINGAIILSRLVYKEDIRELGSKNPGFTNFKRLHGFGGATVAVMAIDIFKTILPVLTARIVMDTVFGTPEIGASVALLACMLGHSFPVWYGFKGGKAVLAYLSGVWFVNWIAGLICFGVFAVLLLTVKYMSLASMTFAVLNPIVLLLLGCREPVVLISMALAAVLVVVRHHANIDRLLHGTESKFHLGSKKEKK